VSYEKLRRPDKADGRCGGREKSERLLGGKNGAVFWMLTDMGKRICFGGGRERTREQCCAIWGADEFEDV